MTWISAEYPADLLWEFTSEKQKMSKNWAKTSEICKGFVYLGTRLVDPVKKKSPLRHNVRRNTFLKISQWSRAECVLYPLKTEKAVQILFWL